MLTNCSASALEAVNAEGLVVANAAGLELDVAYEAIAILLPVLWIETPVSHGVAHGECQ